jgi:hypothetical protein
MAERFDVTRKKKIERFNLVDILLVSVELRKCIHHVRTANGTTEGINLVAQSWGRRNLREGDEVVIT